MRHKGLDDGDGAQLGHDGVVKVERWRGILLLELLDDVPAVHCVGAVGIADGGAAVIFGVSWVVGVVGGQATLMG